MEQSNAGKWAMVSILLFAIALMTATSFLQLAFAWGCGDQLFCSVFQTTSYTIMTLNGFVALFALAGLIHVFNISRANLRIVFLCYIVVLVVLTTTVILFSKDWILNSAVRGTVIECILLGDPSCYEQLAYQKNDVTYCKKSFTSSRCYAYFYEKTNDLSVCPEGNIQCSLSIAKKTKNSQICEAMNESLRFHCYAGLAEATGDLTYCEKSGVLDPPCSMFLTKGSVGFGAKFLTLANNTVKRSEKNALLAKIQLASKGGETQVRSLSFAVTNVPEEMKDIITNLKVHLGDQSDILADANTTYTPDAKLIQIEFRFNEKGVMLDIPRGKTLELSITGDAGNYSRDIEWNMKKYSVYLQHKLSEGGFGYWPTVMTAIR